MRWRGAKRSTIAAWFGVLALALNALVPIHLTFDLVEALAPAHHEHGDAVRRVLALVVPHHDDGDSDADHHDGDRGHHHGSDCPVCSALASLAGLAMPAVPVVALPLATAAVATLLPAEAEPLAAVPTGYRSRAPPLA